MAAQRQPNAPAKRRTIAALIAKKNVAEAVSDGETAAACQAEIERVAAD